MAAIQRNLHLSDNYWPDSPKARSDYSPAEFAVEFAGFATVVVCNSTDNVIAGGNDEASLTRDLLGRGLLKNDHHFEAGPLERLLPGIEEILAREQEKS